MNAGISLFNSTTTLDPSDWGALRSQSHRMLDDILDYVSQIRERPVWQPAPESVAEHFQGAIPLAPQSLSATHDSFMQNVLPLRDWKCTSRIHGVGAWWRFRRRNVGGNASIRNERQSRGPRSNPNPSRAASRSLDATTFWLS